MTNDVQNTTQKTKDQATRTPLKTGGGNSGAPEGKAVPAPLVAPIYVVFYLYTCFKHNILNTLSNMFDGYNYIKCTYKIVVIWQS